MKKCYLGSAMVFAFAMTTLHAEPKDSVPADQAAAPAPEEAAAQEAARTYAEEQGVADKAISAGLKKALWKEDKQAVAMCFEKKTTQTLCLVLIQSAEKKFIVVDVSRVEGMNLWKIDWGDAKYTRVTTIPEKWRGPEDKWWSTSNALCQVQFTTRAWKGKQRYTTNEPLVIRKDLTPWWR
jgi:hypothetical protein